MRKLASIQKITAIRPIPNADAIEAADVLGWTVVVKKGDFSVGDLVVYFEVDSWLDASNPAFASFEERFTNWGNKRGMRLKTLKLRKQISQGLILSIGDFACLSPSVRGTAVSEGDDVTDILKIEKWESKEETQSISGGQKASASASRPFPYFIRKTDQERVQNMIHEIPEHKDDLFEVSIKLDGSSMTVYAIGKDSKIYPQVFEDWENRLISRMSFFGKAKYKVLKFFGKNNKPDFLTGVCSRNIELSMEDTNHFVEYVKDAHVLENITESISSHDAVAFQGELIGPSIQNNHENVKVNEWYVFDVFNIDTQGYIRPDAARFMTDVAGLNYVPVKHHAVKSLDREGEAREIVELILADAEGPGMNPGVLREGLVYKSLTSDFSFKAISNSYLLKKG